MTTRASPAPRELRGRPSNLERLVVNALQPTGAPGNFDRIVRALADDIADRVAQRVSEVLAAAAQAQLSSPAPASPTTWLDPKAAGQRLGISVKTLEEWRREGSGPPFVKMNGRIRYNAHVVDKFAAAGARAR